MAYRTERIIKANYTINRSSRKTVALVVHQDNRVEIRCPFNYSRSKIEKFLEEKSDWIRQKQMQNDYRISVPALINTKKSQIESYKQQIKSRIACVLDGYDGPLPEKWIFRRQKTRWGSCSSKRQISINLHAVFLPDDLFKYLIMHEISHLVHMNHGKEFWIYMEKYVPGAKDYRKKLNMFRLPD